MDRDVDTDVVLKLFAAEEGTQSEKVIQSFKKDLPSDKESCTISEVADLLQQSKKGKLSEPEKELAGEVVNGAIHEQRCERRGSRCHSCLAGRCD